MSGAKSTVGRFGVNQVIPLAAALMALAFIGLGLGKYGFWSPTKGPLPGFFPVVVATGMLVAAVFAFVFSLKEEAASWPRENWMVVWSALLVIGGTYLVGMVPSLAIYLLLWLRAYEKCSWKTTLVTFAVIMAIVVGCFVLWLGVQFPMGIVFDAIFRQG